MKKFARIKTLSQLRGQCRLQGVPFLDAYYKAGGDTVMVGTIGRGHAVYNVVNGRFFGRTHKGTAFNSDRTTHERVWWFKQLLAFFYVEKP